MVLGWSPFYGFIVASQTSHSVNASVSSDGLTALVGIKCAAKFKSATQLIKLKPI